MDNVFVVWRRESRWLCHRSGSVTQWWANNLARLSFSVCVCGFAGSGTTTVMLLNHSDSHWEMFRPSISILSISLSPASFGQRLAQHVWASHWTRVPMFKQVFAAPPGLWSISYDDPTLTLNKDRFQMSVFCVFSQFWTLVQTFTLRLSDFEMKTWNFIVVFKGIHLIFYSVWHTDTHTNS